MRKLVKVTLLYSAIGRRQDQKDTLRGLGLTKLHKTVLLENTSAMRGMIQKVQHLVRVEAVDEKAATVRKAEPRPSYRVLEG